MTVPHSKADGNLGVDSNARLIVSNSSYSKPIRGSEGREEAVRVRVVWWTSLPKGRCGTTSRAQSCGYLFVKQVFSVRAWSHLMQQQVRCVLLSNWKTMIPEEPGRLQVTASSSWCWTSVIKEETSPEGGAAVGSARYLWTGSWLCSWLQCILKCQDSLAAFWRNFPSHLDTSKSWYQKVAFALFPSSLMVRRWSWTIPGPGWSWWMGFGECARRRWLGHDCDNQWDSTYETATLVTLTEKLMKENVGHVTYCMLLHSLRRWQVVEV